MVAHASGPFPAGIRVELYADGATEGLVLLAITVVLALSVLAWTYLSRSSRGRKTR